MSTLRDTYEAVIGLEVHAQLMTKSKMFCSCPNEFGAKINTNVCPVCTGQPGSLPTVNRNAIELGVRAAIALNCQIRDESIFARKNYFYPDLPKGYQISQYEKPFCEHGKLTVKLKSGEEKQIGITRIHFEEDAGKNVHAAFGTVVNLNRAGVPLIEIVSEPDMRTSHEAGQYLRALHSILRYGDICDGNMEQGNFRCDANISVRKRGETKFGTKVELKNINSFRFVEKAIDHEIDRQIDLVEKGETIKQQTRTWNSGKNITELMREKESAHDYRYFPDPDLSPLRITKSWQDKVRGAMPEMPEQVRQRFQKDYNLSDYDAGVLTASKELALYYQETVKICSNPKASANWVANELLGRLNAEGKEVYDSPVSAMQLGDLIGRIDQGEISGKIAKTVFEEMFATRKNPADIIKAKGLVQISDTGAIETVIDKVIAANPAQYADYKAGKVKLFAFFVGQVMKETRGQANPGIVNDLVKKKLDS
ncbi:MAG: Asp-tRNA(Asn)/Glu-tRNA(Gln) amidotransferase subunit GatB [Proteobacteria bacterium]|nr:Asp-tRNA(Asn)/Glu-tRNA(Gln) amidotransferase subunit GatB [Pseudomonadota bacterium]